MEEDGEESPRTPFWVQSSRGRQFRISSIFLNSTILIIFLCLSAIFSILFIIPWFLSLTSQIFRPNLVKKTWDWLNAVLIILALIFGFLSRNKNTDDDRKLDEEDRTLSIANKSRSHFQWDRFSDEGTSDIGSYNYSSSFGLKRNSSSYPDLRDTTSFFDHRKFLDDTHVENSRFVDPDQTPVKKDLTFESDGSKKIYIHTKKTIPKKEISHTPVPVPSPPPKRPSFPPSHNVEEKTDRALKQVTGHWENMIKNSSKQGPPPSTAAQLPEKKKSNKSERKRSGGTATKDFINSFYHQSKKKKKQRAQSLDNFESLLEQIPPSPPSPPPPPPPAKTSVLHNIISNKKRKPKKIISVPAPPPPPPPPAAKPLKIRTLNRVGKTQEDSSPETMGNESPLIPIPPPPPPPFKMPSWKFVVQGDYVRLGSFNSSISESSDTEERESPMSDISIVESSGTHITAAPVVAPENITAAPALFCPSPDVNTKAEMFIAKFRAGLQLQKINSLEQKQRLANIVPSTSMLCPSVKNGVFELLKICYQLLLYKKDLTDELLKSLQVELKLNTRVAMLIVNR
ncbi:serine/arginine repetitive matrix protein 1-like [Impatiens glandulifera]|uniref:serine/arginine repetitive matrix protein 1-like n=1 Tax=Impatiens glandulifera TaxID=253017 RepID=UPI001FB0E910|nr:serine/arginine repetitive matrix protein 1-like [Impatiens glandulifera]